MKAGKKEGRTKGRCRKEGKKEGADGAKYYLGFVAAALW
jgi:hypothetical protein